MAQFRLTHKFASDLKISLREFPRAQFHPLDDWICDVFRVNRRKVALVTHAETLISFLFPYREIGGAKNVLDFLPVELESFLREEGLAEWIPSTLEIFDHEPIFTKTKDRKALGHMNDFKNMVLYSRYEFDEDINWHEVSSKLRETPMIIHGNFTNPHEIFSLYAKLKMNDFSL